MIDLVTSKRRAIRDRSLPGQRLHSRLKQFTAVLCIAVLIAACFVVAPWILWAYNINRAGHELDRGISWPEPRTVDRLPAVRDQHALNNALAHLAAAIRWRPAHIQAPRMAGQIYMAQGDWRRAAAAFEQARLYAPDHPLIAWESALAYEQMTNEVDAAPRENLLADFASGSFTTPIEPINTTYCQPSNVATCYISLDTYTQAFADQPDAGEHTADILFMYPPASAQIERTISVQTPALHFLLGLDPNVRSWQTDGATFEVWITPADGDPTPVFERTMDAATAKRGWVPGFADLTPWIGQHVTLELRTTGGPAGDTRDDWYGWGDVSFTSLEAAQLALMTPNVVMQQAWHNIGLNSYTLEHRGDQAIQTHDWLTAIRWYKRAINEQANQLRFGTLFKYTILSLESRDPATKAILQQLNNLNQTVQVLPLETGQIVWGHQLLWMITPDSTTIDAGSRIPRVAMPDTSAAGIMAWNGRALALVNVQDAGQYRITMRAANHQAFSAQLALGVDGYMIDKFQTERTLDDWIDHSILVDLPRGDHTIDVWFLNDGIENGVDRNAIISFVTINKNSNGIK